MVLLLEAELELGVLVLVCSFWLLKTELLKKRVEVDIFKVICLGKYYLSTLKI